ncbi:uncharacterized protein A1O9_07819, partial [Exophiala aquamarina CBS 119918]
MASEDESQGNDHHHDETEWEAHKENFRRCYMDNNMTRKEAALFMKNVFGFDATPRQWERRIKQWGFQKYSTREERMHQIAQTGKTVLDVSKPGRRPRAQSNNSLHPREDRNLRRFARREVSRSRSRTRSNSFTNSSRPDLGDEFQEAGQSTFDEQPFNPNFASPPLLQPQTSVGYIPTITATGPHPEHLMQLNYTQGQKAPDLDRTAGHDGLFTVDNRKWNGPQVPSSTNQWNSSESRAHMQQFPPNLLSQTSMDRTVRNPNGSYLNEAEPPLGFQMGGSTALSNAQYDFGVSRDSIGINPNVLSNNSMSEQQLYDQNLQHTQVSTVVDETDFNSINFQFDVVDVDSVPSQLNINEDNFNPIPPVSGGFSGTNASVFGINFTGPLQNDVGPLVEELIRNMRDVAIMGDGTGLEHKLSAEAQFFTDRLAIVLDNFTKSQQRAVQDMRRTCSNLRERNKILETMLAASQIQPSIPPEAHPHHSSLPLQPSNYGNLYHQPL